VSRYDLTREQVAALIPDQPRYRASQLWDGLYAKFAYPSECTQLPIAVRTHLDECVDFAPALEMVRESRSDRGTTTKWLFAMDGGESIETVLMQSARRSTLCVSSQAGCAMACSFCATGQMGYKRQLSMGEIVEQVIHGARAARTANRRLDHVVFMGMGEPLANFDNVWGAIERIVGDMNLAARHVTVSTVGVIPGILKLSQQSLQVNLALSLHAGNDALRNTLVPLGRRYCLADVVSACATYVKKTHRRISLEWALIEGVNDSKKDAAELASIAAFLRAHVNLIPLNPTQGASALGLHGSSPERVQSFRDFLTALGANVTIRRTRGRSIDAACGQLAANHAITELPTRP
jgi:23S rRNA (adenine2503-C2)-methyltransferase